MRVQLSKQGFKIGNEILGLVSINPYGRFYYLVMHFGEWNKLTRRRSLLLLS